MKGYPYRSVLCCSPEGNVLEGDVLEWNERLIPYLNQLNAFLQRVHLLCTKL